MQQQQQQQQPPGQGGITANPQQLEALKKQQKWLLFLRHCIKCEAPTGMRATSASPSLPVTVNELPPACNEHAPEDVCDCAAAGQCKLWQQKCQHGKSLIAHIEKCAQDDCKVAQCGASKKLLKHHQKCQVSSLWHVPAVAARHAREPAFWC